MEAPSILITGASSGFGLLTARLALSRGLKVAATARRPEAIPLKSAGGFLKLRLDVTERAAMDGAVEKAIAAFGALDAVVNNAGVANFGAAEEVSEEELRLEFETNFFGATALTKTVLPHLRVPVGQDAQAWCGARFREDEEAFVHRLARHYRWTGTR